MNRRVLLAVPIIALAIGGSTACATRTYVKNGVGEVNQKVESISKSLEETQEQTRQNTQRIAQVDQKVTQVDQKVTEVDQKADTAGRSAADAHATADSAAAKADAVDKASKRLIYEVTLSEDEGGFKFGNAALPPESKAKIDEIATKLKENPNGAYIEIEGHTDNLGPKAYNEKLGLERAESVERYLYERHRIPLHKMSVISYGADKPIAPNTTRAGRAQNRRVVIKVLT